MSNIKIFIFILGAFLLTASTLCEKWEKHKWNLEKDRGDLHKEVFLVE